MHANKLTIMSTRCYWIKKPYKEKNFTLTIKPWTVSSQVWLEVPWCWWSWRQWWHQEGSRWDPPADWRGSKGWHPSWENHAGRIQPGWSSGSLLHLHTQSYFGWCHRTILLASITGGISSGEILFIIIFFFHSFFYLSMSVFLLFPSCSKKKKKNIWMHRIQIHVLYTMFCMNFVTHRRLHRQSITKKSQ